MLIDGCRNQVLDPHYLGYFECFNRGLFYEAHDVLEALWLKQRNSPNYSFYKGLIQFAGAFVHLQKHTEQRPRLKPSAALFRLAQSNLRKYPAVHEALDLKVVLQSIDCWLHLLERSSFSVNPLLTTKPPVMLPLVA